MIQRILFTYLITLSTAVYVLQDDYQSTQFASMFDFFTDDDPTSGYVNYIDQSTAESEGLYKVEGSQIYIGVDNTNVASGRGRNSVRISSKNSYNHGLFIIDLAHMPGGQCGTWPAFWLLGPNWPNGGEVDIIEGVNSQQINKMTLHTSAGCTITNSGQFSGLLAHDNCDINAPGQPANTGCSVNASRDNTYGTGFNNAGGGIYATEWTSERFAIWFFPRNAIPQDISSGYPDPSNWGLPLSEFSGDCDIDAKFRDQQIIFDVTFCGVWAGYDWNFDTTCNSLAPSCNNYVQYNPTAFAETYWQINSLIVYQENGVSAAPTTTTSATSPMVQTTTMTTLQIITSTTSQTTSSQLTSTARFANTTTPSTSTMSNMTANSRTTTTPRFVNATSTTSTQITAQPEIITFTTIVTTCLPTATSTASSTSNSDDQDWGYWSYWSDYIPRVRKPQKHKDEHGV